ncbi:MAG: GIDE domain-containing protein [Candidatus Aenigmatarchaeota archaeon]|nr:E3 ubiquitin ligase family protein [Candidatus Aenigmarchaeota archaeon]
MVSIVSIISTILVGAFAFYYGFHTFRKKRLIEDIPRSKIRSIAMGLVEVYGEVVPIKNKILKSPFTQKDCVYYLCKVEKYVKSYRGGGTWVCVAKEENSTHFYLQDETGKVLVDPRGAEIDLPPSFTFYSGIGIDPPPIIKKFLEAKRLSFEGLFGINKRMRFTEYCILPGSKIYILGTAGDNPFMEEGWAQFGIEDVMIQKDENIYYISDKSEKEILAHLKWKSIFCIILGIFLITFGLLLFLSDFIS